MQIMSIYANFADRQNTYEHTHTHTLDGIDPTTILELNTCGIDQIEAFIVFVFAAGVQSIERQVVQQSS